jgi:cytochrome P450
MTITSDVRFARKYGPLTARTLASNMVREAKHRKRSRPVPLNIELTDFDPFDRATAADPYPRYRELLAGGPVHYNPTRSIFILTRYANVRAAARADHALSTADGVTYGRMKLPVLLTTDAPRHTRMRKQAIPAFTRGALESWQPMVDHLARKLVADMLAQSPAEVVSTLAVPMPMGTIAHILGIDQDQAAFRRWSNDTVRVADVNISKSGLRELVPAFMGFRHMHAFFTEKLSKGELLGQDTVLGRLARHTEDGRLSYDEMFFIAVLLLLAGNETTTNMLSTLFLTLAQRPDQLELLRQRPDLIGSAIEEQLRFASPSRASIAQRGSIITSGPPSSRRVRACCWHGARPTATHVSSPIPTPSTPSATPPGMSRSAPGCICASACSLPGWKVRLFFARSSTTSSGSTSPASRPGPPLPT